VGLTVRQQPVCQGSSTTYNAVTQQQIMNSNPTGGGYQLIGMMSSGSASAQAHGSDSTIGTVAHSRAQDLHATHASKVTSWTSMFE
jgi:hypothetical protein